MTLLQRLNSENFALARLFIGAVFISLSGVFVKLVSVGPTASAFYRTFFGAIILVIVLLLTRTKIIARGRALFWLVVSGLAFAVDLYAWHKSILYVGVGLSTLLANFQVFFMAAAAVLVFGERLTVRQIIAVPLAILGLYLIVGVDWQGASVGTKLGVLFGLVTAVAYSSYLLSLRQAKWAAPSRSVASNLALASIFSTLFLALFAWLGNESLALTKPADIGWLVTYALVGQVLGWYFITSALPFVPTVHIGLALLSQPALSYLWDIVLFGRTVGILEVVGAVVALIAIYLGSSSRTGNRAS